MPKFDTINGVALLVAGLLQFSNCHKLSKDKQVKGVDWRVTLFYCVWGVWNIFYFHNLAQPVSLIGNMFMLAANMLWVFQIFYYRKERLYVSKRELDNSYIFSQQFKHHK